MNRIVLIGNGFDLAHGLKTRYADFINWYWSEWGNLLVHSLKTKETDRFCSFSLREYIHYQNWAYVFRGHILGPYNGLDIADFAKQKRELCDFKINSSLFETICRNIENRGWVNIEDVFYTFLKTSKEPKRLNDDLEFLKIKLIEYLRDLQSKFINSDIINSNIQKQLLEPITHEDVAISSMDKWDKLEPDNIMLLNFNYTNTADMYLPDEYNYSVNHIHGTLSNPESVIFGYGDERDDEYDVLMRKNDNEYLQHIKSFRYLEASNYRDMLAFIESAPYQLCIMGHSCGLSDRTLLATLFEHPNCVSIKPYYHKKEDGSDNYRELVQNIARNFTNPRLMRDRVVRKDRCEPLG